MTRDPGASEFPASCAGALILRRGLAAHREQAAAELPDVALVNLGGLKLKDLNSLDCCTSLKICIVSNNYITNIDALIHCTSLVLLDLHGNQITQLPGSTFWEGMTNLQILNLHDNSIGNKKDIEGLSSCSNLTALTLFDTPFSLGGSYRHYVVNSIWSLKALDNFVISDEEIIEGWALPPKFKAKNPRLFVDLCRKAKLESFEAAMKTVKDIISKINTILACYSPMTIIQRCIRGYLTRKQLGVMCPLCPSGSRTLFYFHCLLFFSSFLKKPQIPKSEHNDMKILQVTVDLTKLMQSETLQEVTSQLSIDQGKKAHSRPLCNTPYQSKISNTTRKKNKGQMNEVCRSKETTAEGLDEVRFRLFGLKALFHCSDPVSDLLLCRRENGKDVRRAIDQFHAASQNARKPQIRYLPVVSAEKRLIAKSYGSISLAPLQVVEKAYRERQKAENLSGKADWVARVRANRAEVRRHVEGFVEDRRTRAQQQRQTDRLELERSRLQQDTSRAESVQRARHRHACFLEEKKQQAAELASVRDFSSQHLSLSKTLLRHGSRERRCASEQEKAGLVLTGRDHAAKQKELIKGCREQR
ncbi:LRIQ3 protein, partial [Atractosteus spatula]|nr:LRIQ3 protein [Atractosteus spatula]